MSRPAADRDALTAFLRTSVRDSRTPGLQYVVTDQASILVDFNDGLADIAFARPIESATTMMAYSMSKTVTAASVLQLIEARKVGLDDPLARHVDEQPYGSAITVRQLLSHTSGIPNPIPLKWVHPAASHAMFDERAALARVMREHPRLAFTPGTKYAYSNIGYWLLGRVVERASGEPFTAYVTNHVLRALDITPDEIAYAVADSSVHASGYLEKYSLMNLIKPWLIDRALIGDYAGPWLHIRDHYLNGPAFGGLVGSARGFSKFLQDQLRDRSRLFGDATRALFREPQQTTDGRAIEMTLGWHTGSNAVGQYLYKEGGGGGFHSMMRLYPAAGIGTAVMANATSFDVKRLLDEADARALGA